MSSQHSAYFLALSAAVLFSGASVVFARFAVSHSSLWINYMKNSVACVAFCATAAVVMFLTGERPSDTSGYSAVMLLLSGILGLGVGDYFLFKGYQRIGSARAIMVFSFSPLFLSLGGFFFFGQGFTWGQGAALLLMMACVWTISFEKFRTAGHWEWKGILYAVIGVLLDNVGVLLSREAFEASPVMSPYTANAVRAVGSVGVVWVLLRLNKERGLGRLAALTWQERGLVFFSGFMGTFLSLTCWLTALKVGHIGGLAGVGSFNPVAASLWEWVLLRKRPTPYLIAAMGLFLAGFFLLLYWT